MKFIGKMQSNIMSLLKRIIMTDVVRMKSEIDKIFEKFAFEKRIPYWKITSKEEAKITGIPLYTDLTDLSIVKSVINQLKSEIKKEVERLEIKLNTTQKERWEFKQKIKQLEKEIQEWKQRTSKARKEEDYMWKKARDFKQKIKQLKKQLKDKDEEIEELRYIEDFGKVYSIVWLVLFILSVLGVVLWFLK